MAGVVIRRFFTGRIKTKNPVYLFLLAVSGSVLVIPLIFAVVETARGSPMPPGAWFYLIPSGAIGLAALTNFIKNLIRINK